MPAIALCVVLVACGSSRSSDGVACVIGGRTFHLEVAADDATRDRGLGGRSEQQLGDGMVFVLARAEELEFVMRDCAHPLDLLFLDDDGHVLAVHEMQPEPARGPAERAEVPVEDFAYSARLTAYPSGVACRLAVEVRAGTARSCRVRVGDRVEIDAEALFALAR
jgi:uncharacterized membrane protein (UPF0127 family)